MSGARPSALYRALILAEAQGLLGRMDREATSPTAGCCDRTYWAWKFVDFPRSRFQEAVCVTSFLFAEELEKSPFHRSPKLLAWVTRALAYWTSLQHEDGSFDEAYPFERSLAATAFTSFYVAEALRFLGEDLDPRVRSSVLIALARAADWLCRHDEMHGYLTNHVAAAAAALAHVSELVRVARFRERSDELVSRILRHQSEEGWYEEYGGADPGYQSHGSFYLARLIELGGGERLAASLERSLEFMAACVHPDGSFGGEYGSRNTKTYYPAAFEMLAPRHPAAAWIARTMRPSVASGAAAGVRAVDAYNLLPFLNNLVFAHLACRARGDDEPPAAEPAAEEGLRWFPEAGIARVRRERYEAWVGTSKGGVLQVHDRRERRLVYSDCAYAARLRNGEPAATQILDRERSVAVEPDRIEITADLYRFSRPTMTPARSLLFRLFTLTLGRSPRLAARLKRLLVHVLVHRRHVLGVRLKRVVRFEEHVVEVTDELSGPDGARLETLRREETFAAIHMGSSRYFVPAELEPARVEGDTAAEVDPAALAEGVRLVRRVRFD